MKSELFYGDAHLNIAEKIKIEINQHPDFLSAITASSPRAVGDAVEIIIKNCFNDVLGEWCLEYSDSFARRAMADLAFKDKQGFYCIVDVKTHRTDANFSMPALVSVERLARFYEDDSNIFSILMVKYTTDGNKITVSDVYFCPVEFIAWKCLTIGALGWGQLQIRDSNNLSIHSGYSRKRWMLEFCNAVLEFYPREILKIQNRIEVFSKTKVNWEQKKDIWQ